MLVFRPMRQLQQAQWYWTLLCAVLFGVFGSALFLHTSTSADVFPKKANYFLQWTLSDSEVTQLAKWDVLVLDMEQQVNNPSRLRDLRKKNPDIILLAYITSQEIRNDAIGGPSKMRDTLARGIAPQWYLVNAAGSPYSFWPGTSMLNVTNHAPLVEGERFNEYLSDFVADEIMGSGLWDGVFYDNAWSDVTWFTGQQVDYNRDGKADIDIDKKWYAGMSSLYKLTRDKTPSGTIIIGNGHTKGYAEALNGKMIENFQTHGWAETMTVYKENHNAAHTPRINIVNTNAGNVHKPNAYQTMRFGLGSTLMHDGYFAFDYGDQNHGQMWWYDEYDVNLGKSSGNARSVNGQTGYAPGVWQREFEQGIAVVNSSPSSATITLPGEYEKIHGTQDTNVNNGAIVSSVTVPSRDGLLLLRTLQRLDNVLFTNGDFARFFKKNGDRVRNGFFLYDSIAPGGAQVGRIDIDGNGKLDTVIVTKNRVTIRRDNGRYLARFRPYGALFSSGLRVTFGDMNNDGKKEIAVAPASGKNPIKIYSYTGTQIGEDWYPFGTTYASGYSVAISTKQASSFIAVASKDSTITLFEAQTRKKIGTPWKAFTQTSVPYVAIGNIDAQSDEEIVVGAGKGGGAMVKVFSNTGALQSQFTAYNTIASPGLPIQLVDVDTDGTLDIVTLSGGF